MPTIPLDAFWGQSRSPNIAPFHMLRIIIIIIIIITRTIFIVLSS